MKKKMAVRTLTQDKYVHFLFYNKNVYPSLHGKDRGISIYEYDSYLGIQNKKKKSHVPPYVQL